MAGDSKVSWFLPAWRGAENQGNKGDPQKGRLRISGDPTVTWFLPAWRGAENQENKGDP